MMFWTLIVVLIPISDAFLFTKCKKQSNCDADHCCVRSRIFQYKAVCKHYKGRGEACQTSTYFSDGQYTLSCPCRAGLVCMNTDTTGMVPRLFGYDGHCVYPNEVAEEPTNEVFVDRRVRKPSTTTTTRRTKPPVVTTTTKPPITTTTRKPPIKTTTITPSVSTTTEGVTDESTTVEIRTGHTDEGAVTGTSEEVYDYFECPENNVEMNVMENDLVTEHYDYGNYDNEDMFNHEVMPPDEMLIDY